MLAATKAAWVGLAATHFLGSWFVHPLTEVPIVPVVVVVVVVVVVGVVVRVVVGEVVVAVVGVVVGAVPAFFEGSAGQVVVVVLEILDASMVPQSPLINMLRYLNTKCLRRAGWQHNWVILICTFESWEGYHHCNYRQCLCSMGILRQSQNRQQYHNRLRWLRPMLLECSDQSWALQGPKLWMGWSW